MNTIDLQEFTNNFMEISNRLTNAEIRMLYLLITEPDVIKLSQQEFAKKIGTHRRTINIGYKNLFKQGYIGDKDIKRAVKSDKNITLILKGDNDKVITTKTKKEHDKNITPIQGDDNDRNFTFKMYSQVDTTITLSEFEEAKKNVMDSFNQFYHPESKEDFIINNDFFWFDLNNPILPKRIKHTKYFIYDTIKESYPKLLFYYEQNKNYNRLDERSKIIQRINILIGLAIDHRRKSIEKDDLLKDIKHFYKVSNKTILKIIKENFPVLVIVGNKIKPFLPPKERKNIHNLNITQNQDGDKNITQTVEEKAKTFVKNK